MWLLAIIVMEKAAGRPDSDMLDGHRTRLLNEREGEG